MHQVVFFTRLSCIVSRVLAEVSVGIDEARGKAERNESGKAVYFLLLYLLQSTCISCIRIKELQGAFDCFKCGIYMFGE